MNDPFELHPVTDPAVLRDRARDLADALAAADQTWSGAAALAELTELAETNLESLT